MRDASVPPASFLRLTRHAGMRLRVHAVRVVPPEPDVQAPGVELLLELERIAEELGWLRLTPHRRRQRDLDTDQLGAAGPGRVEQTVGRLRVELAIEEAVHVHVQDSDRALAGPHLALVQEDEAVIEGCIEILVAGRRVAELGECTLLLDLRAEQAILAAGERDSCGGQQAQDLSSEWSGTAHGSPPGFCGGAAPREQLVPEKVRSGDPPQRR